jgi:crossover junction endodeoxyribonuclease RuvC
MPAMGTERRQIDEASLRAWLEDLVLQARQRGQPLTAYVESVSAMPKQGVASMFTFGCSYGLVRGILCGLRIPYYLVKPQEWQRVVLAGLDRSDPKAAAYLFASRAWPTVDWRATPKCRTPHSGLVDAALIALFGSRQQSS